MNKNYKQLTRTKKYKKLLELYGKAEKKEKKNIALQLNDMQKQYNVTWDFCRKSMIPIGKKYGIESIFALTRAEDVWRGLEKCLYQEGKRLHFSKRGDLPCIRAKQMNRGIVISNVDNKLRFKFNGIQFGILIKDRFEREEVEAILHYLNNADEIDSKAANGFCENTYRPCYASIVCKNIRGKLRVYVHITVEGSTKPKYDRYGNKKHRLGKGIVGCDIGTQTIAYTSDMEVGLKNLAERGSSISKNERRERLLYRAMDRSRRANNPDNYNEDGTIRKGRKKWINSNRYRKLRKKHKELCRVNAINRHLSIHEDINHIRSLGDVFVTEVKNAKKLQKRDKNGKKRFGKSIKNRCCGYFQQQAEYKFKTYIEVSNEYRASQYDHTADEYIKKKLSQRMYKLGDGTIVQRDWYSSYLLYCIDLETGKIDKNKCINLFKEQYAKEKDIIEKIKKNRIKVLNSGIRIS
ncbi:MAG: hypothetical protein Q4C49_14210 [Bacillota bacterium]|nr:hypothetical protein [Bacillota bacterium]